MPPLFAVLLIASLLRTFSLHARTPRTVRTIITGISGKTQGPCILVELVLLYFLTRRNLGRLHGSNLSSDLKCPWELPKEYFNTALERPRTRSKADGSRPSAFEKASKDANRRTHDGKGPFGNEQNEPGYIAQDPITSGLVAPIYVPSFAADAKLTVTGLIPASINFQSSFGSYRFGLPIQTMPISETNGLR